MACPFSADVLDKVQQLFQFCRQNTDILYKPEFAFLKDFIESFGGKVPAPKMAGQAEPDLKTEAEEDQESDLELDMTGCIEPDVVNEDQEMGDSTKEVPEEEADKADEKRREAMSQFSEGNFEKSIELYTEAIKINPQSALLFAKRGQAFLKLNKPNACIKDCTRALELNPDSAQAYKFRGKAYRLIGEFQQAAKDLRQACNIDFDEQTDEWLKEVTPNATKIEQHLLKQQRKKLEKKAAPKPTTSVPKSPFGAPNADLFNMMNDPDFMAAFQDPEVSAAFQDIASNFSNFVKYKDNPKVMRVIKLLQEKFPNLYDLSGGLGNMMGGMASNVPPSTQTTNPADDDNLD